MRRCLELAVKAGDVGNTAVGSLVARDGKIIAEAGEGVPKSLDVTAHAEILAVRAACEALSTTDLSDCTLYSTAEPCWMCAYAIRETRIKTVIFGTPTLDVGAVSTGYPLLTDATIPGWGNPPEVVAGVLADACEAVRSGRRG